jgi:isocitrate dehydrogenase
MFMSKGPVRRHEEQMQDAFDTDLLLSVHVKATMMKARTPSSSATPRVLLQGHFRQARRPVRRDRRELLTTAWPGSMKRSTPARSQKGRRSADLKADEAKRPRLAMVDSAKGITNLHAPNDVIVDALCRP